MACPRPAAGAWALRGSMLQVECPVPQPKSRTARSLSLRQVSSRRDMSRSRSFVNHHPRDAGPALHPGFATLARPGWGVSASLLVRPSRLAGRYRPVRMLGDFDGRFATTMSTRNELLLETEPVLLRRK